MILSDPIQFFNLLVVMTATTPLLVILATGPVGSGKSTWLTQLGPSPIKYLWEYYGTDPTKLDRLDRAFRSDEQVRIASLCLDGIDYDAALKDLGFDPRLKQQLDDVRYLSTALWPEKFLTVPHWRIATTLNQHYQQFRHDRLLPIQQIVALGERMRDFALFLIDSVNPEDLPAIKNMLAGTVVPTEPLVCLVVTQQSAVEAALVGPLTHDVDILVTTAGVDITRLLSHPQLKNFRKL